jgi:hypothetical protein
MVLKEIRGFTRGFPIPPMLRVISHLRNIIYLDARLLASHITNWDEKIAFRRS